MCIRDRSHRSRCNGLGTLPEIIESDATPRSASRARSDVHGVHAEVHAAAPRRVAAAPMPSAIGQVAPRRCPSVVAGLVRLASCSYVHLSARSVNSTSDLSDITNHLASVFWLLSHYLAFPSVGWL